jgi:serine/threonine protein kinase
MKVTAGGDTFAVKLIDFGLASVSQTPDITNTYVQSRYYRSPEVLLGLRYTATIDMWSLACTLVELYTGRPQFAGEKAADQLRKQVEVLGKLSASMLRVYGGDDELSKVPEMTQEERGASLCSILRSHRSDFDVERSVECCRFRDLLLQMFEFDPSERVVASDALLHVFSGPLARMRLAYLASVQASVQAASGRRDGGETWPRALGATTGHYRSHQSRRESNAFDLCS